MEFLSKVATALLFGITVIIVSTVVVFTILTIEFKLLISKRKRISAQLTKQEQRILELSSLINNATASVSSYIEEISNRRQELQDKKCNCSQISANNTEIQKE